jgi:CRISPR system Cascade subunit CasD
MNNPYLFLWLEAPLQAWGHDSKFGRRDTLDFPTKSGVLGLLCCARGAAGEESAWLAEWAELDMQVTGYVPKNSNGHPRPRQPPLRDFHMVGNGYDDGDPWQNLMIPKTSEGKKAVGGGAKLTHRHYVQDMAYAVALQAPTNLVRETIQALLAPTWDIYLGRKSCAPVEFIFQGLFDSDEQVLRASQAMAEEKNRAMSLRVLQGEHEGEVVILNDVPIQFGPTKRYRERCVTILKNEEAS